MGTQVTHGTNKDENIIVEATLDKAGRMTALRHPDGRLDTHHYDQLNRRTVYVRNYNDSTQTTEPDEWIWSTDNSRWEDGTGTEVDMNSSSGANGVNDQNLVKRMVYANGDGFTQGHATRMIDTLGRTTQRNFDPAGRLMEIDYGDPASTPTVQFAYDLQGNRSRMTEIGAASATVRETQFAYDDVRRMKQVSFDTDGDTTVEQTVAYDYDAGGLRTRMTFNDGSGDKIIEYTYDEHGRLDTMTDWESPKPNLATFSYDKAGRHISTKRVKKATNPQDNEPIFDTSYVYDPASYLRVLRHENTSDLLAEYAYQVDGRGNRTQARETTREGGAETISHTDPHVDYTGVWDVNVTDDGDAIVSVTVNDIGVTLRMGEGPGYSMYDVYINGAFWQTFDGYASVAGTRDLTLPTDAYGPYLVEVRNRRQHSYDARQAGVTAGQFTLRFEQITVTGQYDVRTIQYTYDAISRLLEARYNPGIKRDLPDADLLQRYQYTYDLAGNRETEAVSQMGGSPISTTYTYNAVNQMTGDGANTYSYDANGNLTGDGINTYTWDRANHLLSVGNTSYVYDGAGHRIQQTVSSVVTDYLLDMQPGLTKVLAETTGANTTAFIHGPRGIHAREDNAGVWNHYLQDGLGSVRGLANASGTLTQDYAYEPYGTPEGATPTDFGFTGEQTDTNGLLYLRARYYDPATGVFTALDPFEGTMQRPMSMNGYSWVEGNTPNMVDPTGMTASLATSMNGGMCANSSNVVLQSNVPCPSVGQHPMVTTNDDFDWLVEFGFCSGGQKLRLIPDIVEIRRRVESKYPIRFDGRMAIDINTHTWDDLTGIVRGLWLIEKALDSYLGSSLNKTGRSMVNDVFSGTSVIIGPDYDTGISLSDEIAQLAFTNESTSAVVPPPGIGGAGNKVYIRSVSERMSLAAFANSPIGGIDRTFIHELAHVLDFRLGSKFNADTFREASNPSTALMIATGGEYVDTPNLTCARYLPYNTSLATNLWGVCIGSRLRPSGYVPGGQVPTGYAATDHFEDFAETWEHWILMQSAMYHTHSVTLDTRRATFMDSNIESFVNRAST